MDGESTQRDFKLTHDPSDKQAQLGLLKDLIAMANSGGGEIVFGRSETEIAGIQQPLITLLDSARLADAVGKFASPATMHIEHEDTLLTNGRILRSIRVAPVEYPIVMAIDGNYSHPSNGSTQAVFRKGDIWIRHSSKTERATYEDLRYWIERLRRAEREIVLSRITKVIDIPDGAEIQIVPPSAVPALDTPQRMLEYAAKRRVSKPSYVLPKDDLVDLFIQRAELQKGLGEKELSLIIASALRRPTTLYWWLLLAESNPVIILSELEYCLTAADRDKSDAAGSVIELAAIYADDEHLEQLRSQLASSRYQHFRSAVQNWNGRSAQLARLRERISNTKFRENLLNGQPPPDDLEEYATELALRCKIENSIAARRQLGDTTRFIWSQLSIHARARNLNPY